MILGADCGRTAHLPGGRDTEWQWHRPALVCLERQIDNTRIINRENMKNAWAALHMIRDTLEELGPVGCVAAEELVKGPEFIHEAGLLVEGIRKMAGRKL
jgi:hypothetical protein